MSVEKIEELKKRMMEAHALSDEDLEKVSGGNGDGITVPAWLRLDGNYCYEDCCGRLDKDTCGYTFCPRGRWSGTVSDDS